MIDHELIQLSRKHQYEISEGFCPDTPLALEWDEAVTAVINNLRPEARLAFELNVQELSSTAHVPPHIAASTLINFYLDKTLSKYLDKILARKPKNE
jgi:hypothetical protein